jgi:hypothetical protein
VQRRKWRWRRGRSARRPEWTRETGSAPWAADPSTPSPTSPSPYNEGRPSSLLPNADAAQPAAGREAAIGLLTRESYNLHIFNPSASLMKSRYT